MKKVLFDSNNYETEEEQIDLECDWENLLEQASKVKGHCLVTGYFMAWCGKQEGGKIFPSLKDAIAGSVMSGDSSPVFSIDKKGLLTLDETHHDAPVSGNYYEFRLLSAKGEKYYAAHSDDDRRTLHEALKEKQRTRRIPLKIFDLTTKDFVEQNV